jgi:glutathione S-transferase
VTELVLYGPELAPFVDKVRRALHLKKLEYRLVEPQGPEDYRRWSPTGLLPVLDIDGERIPDSALILDALDARWPEPPLVSPDPKVAEAQRRLEKWSSETFFFYWERYLRHQAEDVRDPEGARSSSPGILARFGILRRNPPEPTASDRYAAEFAQRIEDLAGFLGTRPFFHADRISRADLAVLSFLRNLRTGLAPGDELVQRQANLIEWYDRVEQATEA